MKTIAMKTADWKAIDGCLSRDKARIVLSRIKIADGAITATNGMILLKAAAMNPDSLPENGSYEVMRVDRFGKLGVYVHIDKKEEQFPDTDKYIPETNGESLRVYIGKDPLQISHAMIQIFRFCGMAFNYALLEHLAPFDASWRVTKANTVIRLDIDDGSKVTAVVLPFKVDDLSVTG